MWNHGHQHHHHLKSRHSQSHLQVLWPDLSGTHTCAHYPFKWPLGISWHPEHGVFLVSSNFNFTPILFALSSWLHIKTEIHDMIYLQIFFISLSASKIILLLHPKTSEFFIPFPYPQAPCTLLNPISLALSICLWILSSHYFSHLLLQVIVFLQGLFLNLHMSVYSLVMQKTLSSAVWLFPNHQWFSTSPLISSFTSLEKEIKRVAPKIKHSTTGFAYKLIWLS